jgi:dihydroflavonol-4-reductase
MKALVTGASGFIGSHVTRALIDAGHEVTVFRRASSPLANLTGLEVAHAIGDLSDDVAVRAAVRGQDAVFHVAGLYAVWARDRREFWDVNVEGTRRVLTAAAEAGVRRIVYTSTVGAVRGSRRGEIADERSEYNLSAMGDPYVDSKRQAEEVALELAHTGVPVVVVNPSAPIGPGDLRPTPTGDLVLRFVNGRLPGYTNGGVNLVDVRDVARGHLLAHDRGTLGDRYILGGHNLSIGEVMQLLARITGLRAPPLRLPAFMVALTGAVLELVSVLTKRPPMLTRSAGRLLRQYLHFSSEKAERELGYKARPIEQSIHDAILDLDGRGMLRARRMKKVRGYWEGRGKA